MEPKWGSRMTPLLFIFSFIVTLTSASISAQQVWSAHYGGVYNDGGYACVATPDHGYAAAGSTFSYGSGNFDVYLLALDSLGDTLWTRSIGDTLSEYGRDIQNTPDGGFIIAGSTNSIGNGKEDVLVIRTDRFGNTLWMKTYGGKQSDEAWSIRATPDSGYIVCGTTYSSGHGYGDLYLLKISAQGDSLWSKTYGGAGGESGYAVRVTPDGGLIAVGATGSFGTGYSSLYAVRTTSAGDSIWAATFGGAKADLGYTVELGIDGGFLFAGVTAPASSAFYDMYVVKSDDNGNLQWERYYGGAKEDCAYGIATTIDGNYLIAGSTESFGAGAVDMYLVKIDPAGNEISEATYGGRQNDYCRSVVVDHTGRYLLAGFTYSYSQGGADFYLVGTQGDEPTDVFERGGNGLPSGFALEQNYPNPFNMSSRIQFSIPARATVTLTIYNILGQEVRQWPQENLPAGQYTVEWDGLSDYGAAVASGVYFYRIAAGQYTASRKMILLK
jgi:hypothetical protein